MKRVTFICLVLLCGCLLTLQAQNRGAEQQKMAQEYLAKREYIKARYTFLQAYYAYAQQKEYVKAVECGVQVSALYHRENLFKEGFDVLRNAEMLLTDGEQAAGKHFGASRFLIYKERLRMYMKLKNPARAKEQLTRMEETARTAASDTLKNDLLYTKADFYYASGQSSQGDAAIRQLIQQYKTQKAYDRVTECYRTLIGMARRSGNAALTARSYEQLMLWTDSVKALTAQDEYQQLKQKYDESLATIADRDDSLSAKQYIIAGLCVLALLLAVALVAGAVVLLRFILLTRKQKRAIDVANEHNELKTQFIRNISAQMEPTLQTLDAQQPGVQALRLFADHIQELSDLENSLSESYPLEEKNVSLFCENVMQRIQHQTKEGVSLTVNAPKLSVKICPEPLERVLTHLLENAAIYTPEEGKIWLDYKKRGAHTQQFIVTDTGCGIAEEQRDLLFKPFAEVKDLTQGDGLGLPICSLLAAKMNGSLTIDPSYTKGARFVLELHV